ncbi:MAG: SRPBCC family protein [Massilia sp.]
MSTVSDTDRVERSILINGSRERVWDALTDAAQFGAWFGADLTGQEFAPGKQVRGKMTMPGCEHITFDALVERVEPRTVLTFRWHPYAVDPAVDYSGEQRTLVTFTLKDAPGNGILLTVVESGFDQVPAHRRAEAFQLHGEGWDFQLKNIARHVGE